MDSSKSKLIFVHDFGLDSSSWKSMIDSIYADIELSDHFEIYNFSYKDLWSRGGYNSMRTIAHAFGEWIEEIGLYDSNSASLSNITDSLFFVCHGHGGLILCSTLQSYIEQNFSGIHNYFLRRIRQIVFFETPLISIDAIDLIKKNKVLAVHISSLREQSEILENLADEIEDSLSFFYKKIISADDYIPNEFPISTLLLFGENEPNLPFWFPTKIAKKIDIPDKTKTSIINNGASFSKLKTYLLNPIGHINSFEIEYRYSEFLIEPNTENPITITYGNHTRKITSENKGHNTAKVKFSRMNICDKPFTLRYSTTAEGGGIEAEYSPLNAQIASREKINLYEKELREFTFDFIAAPNQEFRLSLEIYKGFDGIENQHAHFHIGNGKYFYKNYQLKLDLSKFSPDLYRFILTPEVHFFEEDNHECSETINFRIPEYLVEPTSADENSRVWIWNFYNIRSGVVDLFWKLVPLEIETLYKPKNTDKTIKIFLASSFELKQERMAFQQLINEVNIELTSKGVCLKLIMWEHQSDAFPETRSQDEYNKLIPTCDIFVGLFFTKIGKYTLEEFNIARALFKEKKKPNIHLYFKDGMANLRDLLEGEGGRALFELNEELKKSGHFNSYFTDEKVLKNQFKKQIDLYLDNLIEV